VHLVDQGIDSGPLLHVAKLPIKPGEALLHQIADIYPLAIPYLLAAIASLSRGEVLAAEPQGSSTRCYRSFPSSAEIAAFSAAGGRFWDALPYQQLLEKFQPEDIGRAP
jgi:hypothetical protein